MLEVDVTGLERWVGFDSIADFFSNFDTLLSLKVRARVRKMYR